MIKALLGIGCALIGFVYYCCCRVASEADERMERMAAEEWRKEGE